VTQKKSSPASPWTPQAAIFLYTSLSNLGKSNPLTFRSFSLLLFSKSGISSEKTLAPPCRNFGNCGGGFAKYAGWVSLRMGVKSEGGHVAAFDFFPIT
jgi:hypothetical protein